MLYFKMVSDLKLYTHTHTRTQQIIDLLLGALVLLNDDDDAGPAIYLATY